MANSNNFDEIQRKAFELWEAEGRPEGKAAEHWEAAEKLLGGGATHSTSTETTHVAKSKEDLDKDLDAALDDSFPASDPPNQSQPTGTEPAGDPKRRP